MSVNYYEPPAPHNPTQPGASKPNRAAPQLPPPKKRGAWSIFFNGMGAGITWFRNALMNTLFIVVLIIFIIAVSSSAPQPLPETFALRLAPTGLLVDQRSYIDPASLLLSEDDPEENETVVSDVVEAINKAAKDKRVTMLVLEPGRMLGGGV
ncbi:MAG TPA: signal peptide peptidase SppA, partial [Cellvibrio sp.]